MDLDASTAWLEACAVGLDASTMRRATCAALLDACGEVHETRAALLRAPARQGASGARPSSPSRNEDAPKAALVA